MDSTPSPPQQLQSHQPLLSVEPTPRKLPIKRKTPHSSFSPNPNNSPPIYTPTDHGVDDADPLRPPPFKFHRIWTEPDEIRFLQGLLDCASVSLSFPRDLNVFFDRFNTTMPQPYTKSQLSEKLRRLRKKFRVISARLAKGLDESLLSPHDRALFGLSKQLWHPDCSPTSPFGSNNKLLPVKNSNLVGVKVSFAPSINNISSQVVNDNVVEYNHGDDGCYEDVKLSEVNVEFDEECVIKEEESNDLGNRIGGIVGKTVVDAFDKALNEAKMGNKFVEGGEGKDGSFEKRWREIRVAEMEALAQRLRLVVEDSLQRQ